MAAKKKYEKILTPEFRLVQYSNSLFEPAKKSGKYEIKLLFAKDADLKALKVAILNVVKAEQPDVYQKMVDGFKKFWPEMPEKIAGFGQPFRDGDEKKWPGFAGHVYLSARTQFEPGVIDRKKQKITDPEQVYSGIYARAVLLPNSYPSVDGGSPGFNFMLQSVQIIRPGEKLFSNDASSDYDDLPPASDDSMDGLESDSSDDIEF